MATTWRPKPTPATAEHRSGKAKFYFPDGFTPPIPNPPELLLPWEDRPGGRNPSRRAVRIFLYGGMLLLVRIFLYGGMLLLGLTLTLGLECRDHRGPAPDADHPAAQPRPADPNVTPELDGAAGPTGRFGPTVPRSSGLPAWRRQAGPTAFRPACLAQTGRSHGPDSRLLAAIAAVESGGQDRMVGDQGRSRGRYQIQRAYWAEGCHFGRVAWSYDRYVTDPRRCEQVMRWYWAAHAARTPQAKARVHNGGPGGMHVGATVAYWARVRSAM